MKSVDLDKLELAIVCALTEFWKNRPPLFSLARKFNTRGDALIEITLHGRSDGKPVGVLEVLESDFGTTRTAAYMRRCAAKMAYCWTNWVLNQLGEHDVKRVMCRIPYKNIAANFPLVAHDTTDIFVAEAPK